MQHQPMRPLPAAAALLFSLSAPLAAQTTRTVSQTPADNPDFSSINAAIAVSSSGDTIQVIDNSAVLYSEAVDYLGLDLVIEATNARVVITAPVAAATPSVTFSGGETRSAVLQGFSVSNNAAGGIFCDSASPRIVDCFVENNGSFTPPIVGMPAVGGIFATDSSPSIEDCLVQANISSGAGAGIRVEGTDGPSLVISICDVLGNSALGLGGGISILDHPAGTVSDSRIDDNTSVAGGGGIAILGAATVAMRVLDCNIEDNATTSPLGTDGGGALVVAASAAFVGGLVWDNDATGLGGGIAISGSQLTTLTDVPILEGTATSGGNLAVFAGATPTIVGGALADGNATALGAGMYVLDSSPRVLGTLIRTNGELGAVPVTGGGVAVEGDSAPFFDSCEIRNNFATFQGAGAYVNAVGAASPTVFLRCLFEDNGEDGALRTTEGGGLAAVDSAVDLRLNELYANFADVRAAGVLCLGSTAGTRIDNNVIGGNTVTPSALLEGSGLHHTGATPSMTSNTIAYNTGTGAGISFDVPNTGLLIYNLIAWGNSGDQIRATGSLPLVRWSSVQNINVTWQAGPGIQVGVDPQLVNPAGLDFHIQPTSPCRNVGLPGAPGVTGTDFDLEPRIDPTTNRIDIGADEVQ
ncbi:MAG: right-handed parallel beta-helix repeat-containing protein [Planctomycetota bacterium]